MSAIRRRVMMMMAKMAAAALSYATWNPADKSANVALSNGNRTATTSAGNSSVRATLGKSAGKWYWECTPSTVGFSLVGVGDSTASVSQFVGQNPNSIGYYAPGQVYANGGALGSVAGITNGDVIGIALDATGRTVAFYKNNVLVVSHPLSAAPSMAATVFPMLGDTSTWTANFGATALVYAPPSGYNAGLYT